MWTSRRASFLCTLAKQASCPSGLNRMVVTGTVSCIKVLEGSGLSLTFSSSSADGRIRACRSYMLTTPLLDPIAIPVAL